jgi:YaaC-like Protein
VAVLQRFEIDEIVGSTQSGYVDNLDWLGFLCAKDYLVALLRDVHGMTARDAEKRSTQIIPHVRLASGYIRQSQEGPSELSYLPAYYAILNLMKVYVLLGPRHAELASNRWHGATYEVGGKDSHSILTEEIVLRRGGVFPLFYSTITGRNLGTRPVKLQVRDFLKFVSGVAHEYTLATGQQAAQCGISFVIVPHNGVNHFQAHIASRAVMSTRDRVQCLHAFTATPPNSRILIGPPVANPQAPLLELRACVHTHLLYRINATETCAMITNNQNLQYPQEFPIALLFFYMSSIVRYRPEFFARLRDSKYWPVISSARIHAFLDFLFAFWSYVQKRNYFVTPR